MPSTTSVIRSPAFAARPFRISMFGVIIHVPFRSGYSGLAGAATFESSILDLALVQPSCWNMGSNDETRVPALTCRSYHRLTARLRSVGEADITAWCHLDESQRRQGWRLLGRHHRAPRRNLSSAPTPARALHYCSSRAQKVALSTRAGLRADPKVAAWAVLQARALCPRFCPPFCPYRVTRGARRVRLPRPTRRPWGRPGAPAGGWCRRRQRRR